MKRIVLLSLCLAVAALTLTAPATGREVRAVKEYGFSAAETDSKIDCRGFALARMRAEFLESLGTYVESRTRVSQGRLAEDEITALTAGMVQAVLLEERWDGENYFLRAELAADPQDIARRIDARLEERARTEREQAARERERRAELAALEAQRNQERERARALERRLLEERRAREIADRDPGSIRVVFKGKAVEDIGLSVFTLGIGLIPTIANSAEVWVDGDYVEEVRGYGDVLVTGLAPGPHEVRLLKNGKAVRFEESVDVQSGRTTRIELSVDTNFRVLRKTIHTAR